MKSQIKSTVVSSCILAIIVIFVGCARADVSEPTITPETQLLAATLSEAKSPTITLTVMGTNTSIAPTIVFTKTPPPTNLPPLPTLPPETAKTKILEFLKDNGGCKLPCVWGVNPSVSTLPSVFRFTDQFGRGSKTGEYEISSSGDIYATFWKNNLRLFIDFGPSAKNAQLAYLRLYAEFTREQRKGENLNIYPVFGDPYFTQLFGNLLLPEILSEYGSPSQVLIYPFFDDPDAPPSAPSLFSLVLIYHEKGIFVEYLLLKEKDADNYIGCPSKTGYLSIITWNPQNKPSLEDIIGRSGGLGINSHNLKEFKSLKEATSMNSDTFLKTFTDGNSKSCITTPQRLWKYLY